MKKKFSLHFLVVIELIRNQKKKFVIHSKRTEILQFQEKDHPLDGLDFSQEKNFSFLSQLSSFVTSIALQKNCFFLWK